MLDNKKLAKNDIKNPLSKPSKEVQHYNDLYSKYVNPALGRYSELIAVKGKGSYLYDINGDAYLDIGTGIAVNALGHCHPAVVKAVQEQAAELMHTSITVRHTKYIELAEKIAQISPGNLDSVFLANSGAEAIEGAIKLARYTTRRPAIINFRGSFHGRTFMAVALTNSKLYFRERLEPLPGPIYTAPFPYVYRSNFPDNPQACVKDCLKQLNYILHKFVDPSQVAAMLIEPIIGEGGYVIPPPGFFSGLREICDKHGILLITDEVQTGFCRTGKWFGIEHEKIVPDIMVLAKAIANGLPLSSFVANNKLTSQWPDSRHGSTFGGNPVACAASLAAINVMQEEKLDKRAEKLGNEMLSRLQKFANGRQHIGEVRGRGLMIGIEFIDSNSEPSKAITKRIVERCMENKLLLLTCGEYGQVIRIIPPLTISDSEAEKACEILEMCMDIKKGDVIHE
jgi:4-aminobutyrate aminotransferase